MTREKRKAGMQSQNNKPNKIILEDTYFQKKGLNLVSEQAQHKVNGKD